MSNDNPTKKEINFWFHKGKQAYKKNLYAEAVKWLQDATDAGHTEAKYYLGLCYYYGDGVQKDQDKGTQLLREAAQDGCTDAMEYLGKYILRYNDYEAYQWLKKAGCDYEADDLMRIHQMML